MNTKTIFIIILIIIFILLIPIIPLTAFEHFDHMRTNNKLYYGLPCKYVKDDCFYNALHKNGFTITNNMQDARLILPCTYEKTGEEIKELENNGIKNNIYGDNVCVFMLSNSDQMVSKISLWDNLKKKYGYPNVLDIAPETWSLDNNADIQDFKNKFNKNKIYIVKNNQQRQEGLELMNDITKILDSKNKYILVQELLQDPYLINGHKINLRVYVLVSRQNNGNTKVMIYSDGFMYYTPKKFEKNSMEFDTNITTGYIDRKIYDTNPLTHNDFKKYLDNNNRNKTKIENYILKNYKNIKLSDYVFSKINKLISQVFSTFDSSVGLEGSGTKFQLYGVDVAINDMLSPMIIEINKGPDLTSKDEGRDKNLKTKLCSDILKSLNLITNTNNGFITLLELANIDDNLVFIENTSEFN